ncbi:hypothetical protein [Levilactobacillus brevis]|uniref:Uncharacterized protein n=1 Tax=Levilactobacillus brevis (strain ATCC 367 / BCRC 12310 / CIP 105137 / JCM 1170 / LMG 11437 / NCIMB 947 / NCTC 947) TaxID=387344 RepID=Q03RC3_LEVBA|nr:hypothetical protein [Levilactobacillus brevis]ABJ64249.1 hypothetical protein LVIS_1120 [Levilactobacillus brevis ATCC 367]MCZ2118615.1 hypothetical protein [Levilactobacillus brevis]MCZ2124201.1 hypothetical protein [Levilactobacillus brevis]MCZ2208521.1 hypothetical protein [Levilactobacillus brevis]MCZ2323985.1 hypothetical protein [Levilactobacillus brevis]
MNENQKVFRRFVLRSFEDHHEDMTRALGWCQLHFYSLLKVERDAIQQLSSRERNAVISEILLANK